MDLPKSFLNVGMAEGFKALGFQCRVFLLASSIPTTGKLFFLFYLIFFSVYSAIISFNNIVDKFIFFAGYTNFKDV